ncbi:MAG: tetratricopeptide repeat protein [SAR324 cluster bacterium]|nr:tetratricopeptide repeat protein [SAR324 cluster bacterium]
MNFSIMKQLKLCLFLCCVFMGQTVLADTIQDMYNRSYQYEQAQDYGNAIKALSEVQKEYPDTYTINYRLGWLYYLGKDYTSSLLHYDRAIKALPTSLDALSGAAITLIAQQKWSQSEERLRTLVKMDRYNFTGNLNLAYVLRMQKQFEKGQKIILKMLELYPTNVVLLTESAMNYVDSGNMSAALALFTDIGLLDPQNPTANYYLIQASKK